MAFVPDKPATTSPDIPGSAPIYTPPSPSVSPAPTEAAGSRFVPDVPAAPAAPSPEVRPWAKALEEGIQGAGETLTSLATGIPATVAGGVSGLYKGVTGAKYGTPEGVREAEEEAARVAQKYTYEPKTETGKEYLRAVGKAFEESKLAGLPAATGELAALGRVPAGAAISQAAEHPVTQAIKSTAGRAAPAARKAASYIIPKPNTQTIALARKAESLGIPLRPDMLTDNRLVNMLGDTLEKIPLAGAKTEQRRVAFNKAIMQQIGADPNATKLTPDVFGQAVEKTGSAIGQIYEQNPVPLDAQLLNALDAHVADASRAISDVDRVVTGWVREIKSKAVNGVIPGRTLRQFNTELGKQIRESGSGDVKGALSNLKEELDDALARNLKDPADKVRLSDLRQKYAKATSIEPLVVKAIATGGDISPIGLMGAISSTKQAKSALAKGKGGTLADIAAVGQRFLKEQPTSGTAERGLIYSLLGGGAGAGAVTDPALAAALYGGTYGLANLYNRLGPAITRKLLK